MEKYQRIGKKLVVKPVLVFQIYQRKDMISWRPWGGLHTDEDVDREVLRIKDDLVKIQENVDFKLEILEITKIKTINDIYEIEDELKKVDVILIYPASGSKELLNKLCEYGKWILFFIRHKSGPIYLWYEIIHPILLRERTDRYMNPRVSIDDIIIDDTEELTWKLRALYGLKNTIGSRIIAVGGPAGWGIGRVYGPKLAKEIWKFDIITITYSELSERLKKAKNDSKLVERARIEAKKYLNEKGVELKTKMEFVTNAFILYYVFKDLLKEHDAYHITINECMGTIMPIARTTACLALSLLNDEGYIAFCESDLVVIPSGVLLHYISGLPVFLNDPTTPHHGIVTLAHCTAPRRMDGISREPADIVTHFESDYGAAPKVYMKKNQTVTVIDPDFEGKLWLGFRGKIIDSPNFDICRSQIDVEIDGDWKLLLEKMRGFHWMLCYGDYLKEFGYALNKIGIKWLNISEH